ncbi:MAG TPA: hypothetical protein VER11_32535 [Polyangiaceae bacterium]|nr:hypothetical protein [Polyangiaceae bacterium]
MSKPKAIDASTPSSTALRFVITIAIVTGIPANVEQYRPAREAAHD